MKTLRTSALLLGLLTFISSCDNDPAIVPAYLHIDEVRVDADYNTFGTSSSKITCVWVNVDGTYQGVYELPATIPLPFEGTHRVEIEPGINLNGIQSLRNIYDFYESYEEELNLTPNGDVWFNASADSVPTITYAGLNHHTITVVEDFENVGTGFERADRADTGFTKINDPSLIFPATGLNETNNNSGMVVMPGRDFLFEAVSVNEYTDLPKGGANVYLEMNYKTTSVVTLGVYRRIPGQVDQVPVVSLFPSPEWNKIYMNLVTEVSAIPNAEGFRLFVGSLNTEGAEVDSLFFDNLKLVY